MNFWTHANATHFEAERNNSPFSRVLARYPKETDCPTCGWNSFTQSGLKSDCTTCNGKGKITTWQSYYIHARVNWTAMFQFSFVNPTPGIEQGDCVLTIGRIDKDVLELILNTPRAYLTVDEKTVRPSSISILEVPHVGEEYQVVCNTFSPTP